jgi:hypothetical protein
LDTTERFTSVLIPGYDLASLLSLRFTVLPAKVNTFLESSKLFVEESKAWLFDFYGEFPE